MEREVLLAKAPHISWPLRFVLPHEPHLRPRWMLRLGLFLYDHLDWHMTLPKSQLGRPAAARNSARGLKPSFKNGFVYSDAWVDDARLVISNLKSARHMGAAIYARHRCVSARRSDDGKLWNIELAAPDGATVKLAARGLVNATGPWVKHFLDEQTHVKTPKRVRLIKGSHIVVPRLHDGDHAFILQNKRQPHRLRHPLRARLLADRHDRHPGRRGREAGLHAGGDRLSLRARQPLHGQAGAAGGRGLDLFGRAAAVRRRRRQSLGGDARLSSRGRRAATAPRRCSRCSAARSRPTAGSPSMRSRICARSIRAWAVAGPRGKPLADGELADAPTFEEAFDRFVAGAAAVKPGLPQELVRVLARRHGTGLDDLLEGVKTVADLGRHFGGHLYEAEVRYLMREEWAVEPEDVLWRRTKEGLHMTAGRARALRALACRPSAKLRLISSVAKATVTEPSSAK